jgi:hypothetical protein
LRSWTYSCFSHPVFKHYRSQMTFSLNCVSFYCSVS